MDRQEWSQHVDHELEWWRKWLETKGLDWPLQYRERCDPSSELSGEITMYLGKPREITALDVGSGPMTSLGKRWAGHAVHITACDALADEYRRLAYPPGLPLVPPLQCDSERLTDTFGGTLFDVVHARNTLDHGYDPMRAICEMARLVKPEGVMILDHHPREATRAGHVGLHQFDFVIEGGRLLIESAERRWDVFEELGKLGSIEVLQVLGDDRCYVAMRIRPSGTAPGKSSAGSGETASASALDSAAMGYVTRLRPLLDASDFAGALTVVQEALKAHPASALVYEFSARTCAHLGRLDAALNSYRTALYLSDRKLYIPTYYAAGAGLVSKGRLDEALAICRDGLQHHPDAWQLHETLTLIYARTGRLDEALDALARTKATKPSPPDAWVYFAVADLMYMHGRGDEATTLVAEAWSSKPDSIDLAAYLSFLWCVNGRYRDGIADYVERSAAAAPQQAWRYASVVLACLQRSDYDSADAVIRIAERHQPHEPQTIASRVTCLLHANRSDEAMNHYRNACAPRQSPSIWTHLQFLAMNGRARDTWTPRLGAFFDYVVAQNPFPDALEGAFHCAFDARAYEKAAELYERLLACGVRPGEPTLFKQRFLRGLVSGSADPVLVEALRRMDLENLDYSIKVSPRWKLVYVNNPKVACTSIKAMLAALEAGEPEYRGFVHTNKVGSLMSLRDLPGERPFEFLFKERYKFFTAVRNPLSRLVSCYRDKFESPPPNDHFVAGLLDEKEAWPEEGISLDWFMEHVLRQADQAMDPHWAGQVERTMVDKINFHFVARFERLSEDLDALFSEVGMGAAERPKIPFLNINSHSLQKKASIGDDLKLRVHERFRQDFDRFSYA